MRARSASAALALLAALSLAGCADNRGDEELVLRVQGTSGLRFSGHYVVTTASGARTQRAIEEQPVPFEVGLSGTDLSAIVLRAGAGGRLYVEILLNGDAIAFAAAKGPLGLVSVATP